MTHVHDLHIRHSKSCPLTRYVHSSLLHALTVSHKPKQPEVTDVVRSIVPRKSHFLPWASTVMYFLSSGLLLSLILLLPCNHSSRGSSSGGSPALPYHPKSLQTYTENVVHPIMSFRLHSEVHMAAFCTNVSLQKHIYKMHFYKQYY